MTASAIYLMCAATALLCTWLLIRAYRRTRYDLLYWSALCFAGLTLNNLLLVVDKVVLPDVEMSVIRTLPALIAMSVLLYGLIWNAR